MASPTGTARKATRRTAAGRTATRGRAVRRPATRRLGVRRRRRLGRTVGMLAVLGALVAGLTYLVRRPAPPQAPACTAQGPSGVFTLDLDQAANASTIASVARRDGLPNHAVTVALAAALQESKLHNLSSGDRDSVGLFQQRPSQGWGSAQDLSVPRLAAEAFFRGLAKVPGWSGLAVTDAAQQVQRSAAGDAYAQWEGEARSLAQSLTGEVPASFGCRFRLPRTAPSAEPLASALRSENGEGAVGQSVTAARGWVVAGWLVGHASSYRITQVAFGGYRWSATTGKWVAAGPAPTPPVVALTRAGVRPGMELTVP